MAIDRFSKYEVFRRQVSYDGGTTWLNQNNFICQKASEKTPSCGWVGDATFNASFQGSTFPTTLANSTANIQYLIIPDFGYTLVNTSGPLATFDAGDRFFTASYYIETPDLMEDGLFSGTPIVSFDYNEKETLLYLGDEVFKNCNLLFSNDNNTLDMTGYRSLESIGNSCFQGCVSLETALLPESLTYIGNEAFEDTLLNEVRIYAVNPPVLGENVFDVHEGFRILVPMQSIEAYKSNWSEYQEFLIGFN